MIMQRGPEQDYMQQYQPDNYYPNPNVQHYPPESNYPNSQHYPQGGYQQPYNDPSYGQNPYQQVPYNQNPQQIVYDQNGYPQQFYQENLQENPQENSKNNTLKQPAFGFQKKPREKKPKKEKDSKKTKTGKGNSKLHLPRWSIIALAVILICGGAFAIYKYSFTPQKTTASVEAGVYGQSFDGEVLIVRDEIVFDEESVQSIKYVAPEGSRISRGDIICYVYSTGYNTREATTLLDYRFQIKNYLNTLFDKESSYDQKMERLDDDVLQKGMEVRSLVQGTQGDLINQEKLVKSAINERQAYIRVKYASDMRLTRLYDDETTQQRRIDSWIKQQVAAQNGIVSFYTDGFEYSLNPAKYEEYSPNAVRSMINGKRPETSSVDRGRTDLYRIVKSDDYVVLMLIEEDTWNPIEGDVYKLVLEQFSDSTVDAKVLSYARAGGTLLLRLAVMGNVEDNLYTRSAKANIGKHSDCLLVPSNSLVESEGFVGVVASEGENQGKMIPLTVLEEKGGVAYVQPVTTGTLYAGQQILLH